MITLLITGVGGPLGQALIKAARQSSIPCRIVGTDRYALSIGLGWVDRPYLIADASQTETYVADIVRICVEEKVSLILPASDTELEVLSSHAAAVRDASGAQVVASTPEILRVALDKEETCNFLDRSGLNFPAHSLLEDHACVQRLVETFGFPLVAKPCRGSGSRGLAKVRSWDDIAYLRTRGGSMVLQEYLQPDEEEYTVAVYTQQNGGQAGSICFKRELVAGNTYRAWVSPNAAIEAEARAIALALGARGPCNVQLRLTARGPVAFEINARFSGTTAMRAYFGYNEVEMAVRDLVLQELVPVPAIRPGIALRFWDERYLAGEADYVPEPRSPQKVQPLRSAVIPRPPVRMLHTTQSVEWLNVLKRCGSYDFYHLPSYHSLAEKRGEGDARLFVYEQDGYLIAIPLLLRSVDGAGGRKDATSVYGYTGPVSSHEVIPEHVTRAFQQELRATLTTCGIVAVFSRLHPLVSRTDVLSGLGESVPGGKTVSIDLTLPPDEQRAQYSGTHKNRINKLLRGGVICSRDPDLQFLPEFVSIYHETMRRVNAHSSYFFDTDYFNDLALALGSSLQLFVVTVGGRVVAGGLFTLCDGIVQYHLGGTRDDSVKLAPMVLIIDTVRHWGNEMKARAFHLGGGVGSMEDSLFQFKASFSEQRNRFSTWRWIVAPEIYGELCAEQTQRNEKSGVEPISRDYFPAYRCPTVRCASPTNGIQAEPARIYLSPPHMGDEELELVREAFSSNWIAPLGPHVDAFEREVTEYVGVAHAAALSSGTAAIHLGLRLLGIEPGDEVLCSTFTFSASANPILYEGGRPVFIDSGPDDWNLDPQKLSDELDACAARGKLPRAVIVVDLYGHSADYDPILEACARFDVPVLQDSAEALGATYKGRFLGSQGRLGVFSFNGNKIITTSGGGMLVSDDGDLIERARFLATQARDPAPHYQHSSLGFNYRMSNVLAGIGRAQLRVLPMRIEARRRNFEFYHHTLGDVPGLKLMPLPSRGSGNYWLTCITIDPSEFGASAEDVRLALAAQNIESRPVWKPLHLQPIFAKCRVVGGEFSQAVFARGLCLPSGSSLTNADLNRICGIILSASRKCSPQFACSSL